MISKCREIRARIMNRSEWTSEKTTDATNRGYLRNAYGVFGSHRMRGRRAMTTSCR